jgi:hypothetical protein
MDKNGPFLVELCSALAWGVIRASICLEASWIWAQTLASPADDADVALGKHPNLLI